MRIVVCIVAVDLWLLLLRLLLLLLWLLWLLLLIRRVLHLVDLLLHVLQVFRLLLRIERGPCGVLLRLVLRESHLLLLHRGKQGRIELLSAGKLGKLPGSAVGQWRELATAHGQHLLVLVHQLLLQRECVRMLLLLLAVQGLVRAATSGTLRLRLAHARLAGLKVVAEIPFRARALWLVRLVLLLGVSALGSHGAPVGCVCVRTSTRAFHGVG